MLERKVILESFGKIIFDYFFSITKENQPFYLFVDEFLFEKFIEDSKYSKDAILKALDEYRCKTKNPFVAISIAAYQVKIQYDLTDFAFRDENSYYERLVKNYRSLSNEKIIGTYFYGDNLCPPLGEADGEKIWTLAKNKFKEAGRILQIAEFHNNAGRFVDLPKFHRIDLGGKNIRGFLFAYADIFIKKNIVPGQFLSFDEFLDLLGISSSDDIASSARNRLIFNFYNIWDGRSSDCYSSDSKVEVNRIRVKKDEDESECIIEYSGKENSSFKIFVNKEVVDSEQERQRILSMVSGHKIVFVRYSENSDYWLDVKRTDRELKNIKDKLEVLSEPKSSSFFTCNGKNFKFEISEYKYRTRAFDVVGGIKIKPFRNVWYSFALPVVKIADLSCQKITMDGKEFELENFTDENGNEMKIFRMEKSCLDSADEPGKRHKLSIQNSSDFSFYVGCEKNPGTECESSGWSLNGKESILKIFEKQPGSQADLDGFFINVELVAAGDESVRDSGKRKFLEKKQILEGRFSIENSRIEIWRKYVR